LVVVNDIVKCIKHQNVDVLLYADNSSINCSGERAELTACIANRTLQKLQNWCSINRMVINSKKTKAIPFGFSDFPSLPLLYDGEAIEYVDSAKVLGVIFDSKLTFAQHVASLRRKISWRAGMIHRLRYYLPKLVKLRLYHALVQSQLAYCSLAWCNSSRSHIQQLFTLEKRCIRTIYNAPYLAHTDALFIESRIPKLSQLFIHRLLLELHKQNPRFMTLFQLESNTNLRTRQSNFYKVPATRLQMTDKSLNVIIPRILNHFHSKDIVIFQLPRNKLKVLMQTHINEIIF